MPLPRKTEVKNRSSGVGGFKLLVLFLGAERSHGFLLGTGFAEFAQGFIFEFAFAIDDLDCFDGFTAFVFCHIY